MADLPLILQPSNGTNADYGALSNFKWLYSLAILFNKWLLWPFSCLAIFNNLMIMIIVPFLGNMNSCFSKSKRNFYLMMAISDILAVVPLIYKGLRMAIFLQPLLYYYPLSSTLYPPISSFTKNLEEPFRL